MVLRGPSSWYGGSGDRLDNDRPALAGATNRTPGIAVYNRSTLGGYWRVRVRDKRGRLVTRVEQQTDLGPAPWTGKKVDLNYALIRDLGFHGNDYHNGHVTAEYLGKRRPAEAGMTTTNAVQAPQTTATPTGPTGTPQQKAILAALYQRKHPRSPLLRLGVL